MHALSRQESSSPLALAVAVGRRVSLYKWGGGEGGPTSTTTTSQQVADMNSPTHVNIGEFDKQQVRKL